MKVLIVDDEQIALTSIKRLLRRRGIRNVELCNHGAAAIARLKQDDFDIVLLDLLMPEVDGLKVLETIKPYRPHTEFIILTAVHDITMAVKALRLGAYDYLVKPADNELLLLAIERAYEHKGLITGISAMPVESEEHPENDSFADIITQYPRLNDILRFLNVMAKSGNPILVTGESGTGKELVARGIHRAGLNKEGPFMAVNVASIPETMFESQFFGHVRGAFTGADKDHEGYFEQANGGTLFLDEIGELAHHLQVKFLRVLEDKLVVRLGDTKPHHVDMCIVSATNSDLDKACQEGRFRLDLFYRLKSTRVHLPPLRERKGDIPLLTKYFLSKACEHFGKKIVSVDPQAIEILNDYNYPGNIRELQQIIDNAILICDGDTILPHHLSVFQPLQTKKSISTCVSDRNLCSLKENDEAHVVFTLTQTNGNRKEAALLLGITIRQLQRKIVDIKNSPRWRNEYSDI